MTEESTSYLKLLSEMIQLIKRFLRTIRITIAIYFDHYGNF